MPGFSYLHIYPRHLLIHFASKIKKSFGNHANIKVIVFIIPVKLFFA